MVRTLKQKKSLYCETVCHAWCCRNLITYYQGNDKDVDTFFKLHGIEYNNETKQMIIPCKCKWITTHNKCKLYAWRPYSCRSYECEKLKSMTIDN